MGQRLGSESSPDVIRKMHQTIDAVTGSVTLNDRPLSGSVTLIGPAQSDDACRKGG
mgnify:CR=1 FL=1